MPVCKRALRFCGGLIRQVFAHGFAHYLPGLVSSQIDLQGSTALTQLTPADMYLATWNLATGISQKDSFVFIFSKKNWHSALPLQQAARRQDERFLCIPPGSPHIVFTRPHGDIVLQSQILYSYLKYWSCFCGALSPSGSQMESQSVEKKQTWINNYSLIPVL